MTRTAATWVKYCGMTCPEDARAACALGIQAIGLVFWPASPRAVALDRARGTAADVPPGVDRIGIFVDADPRAIEAAARACGLTHVQFHGQETPAQIRASPLPAIKAIRVRDAGDLERLSEFAPYAAFLLLDALVPGMPGGTGTRFDWELAMRAAREHRVVLAGGLTPENVAEAVRRIRPWGVDVSSGIESAPGRKDPAKMRAFVEAVRSAGEDRDVARERIIHG